MNVPLIAIVCASVAFYAGQTNAFCHVFQSDEAFVVLVLLASFLAVRNCFVFVLFNMLALDSFVCSSDNWDEWMHRVAATLILLNLAFESGACGAMALAAPLGHFATLNRPWSQIAKPLDHTAFHVPAYITVCMVASLVK